MGLCLSFYKKIWFKYKNYNSTKYYLFIDDDLKPLPILKCPVCATTDVELFGGLGTQMGAVPFYDQNENCHQHDPNKYWYSWNCSNQHSGSYEKYGDPCEFCNSGRIDRCGKWTVDEVYINYKEWDNISLALGSNEGQKERQENRKNI